MEDLLVIILAGGKSKRFWPLSNKNLINFGNFNLLEYHLNNLSKLGIKNYIIVSTPEIAAFLRVRAKNYQKLNINRVIQDEKNHGIGNAILLAWSILEKKYQPGKPIYIINCDDVYKPKLHKEVFNLFLKEKPFGIVVGYKIDNYQPLGYFSTVSNFVTGVIEKPDKTNLPSNIANMSLHLFSDISQVVKAIKNEKLPNDNGDNLYERSLNKIFKEKKVRLLLYQDRWEILKFPWNVLNVMDFFLSDINHQISDLSEIDKTVKIIPPVIIEQRVKVLEYAKIIGPAILREGTIIGNNSLVRNSIIGKECVIGYNTEITRSYLGDNCWFHNNYVGDSVIGNNVSLGSGATLANLRFDQKEIHSKVSSIDVNTNKIKLGAIIGNNTQIGVNASLMPGVKIGKNSLIGPGVVQYEDLEENSIILLKQEIIKKKNMPKENINIRKYFRDLLKAKS